ncbi:MAG: (Fe-S)-binding protein [Chloroflexi bacterium]|nr:(Fe-S)-binding protein [Chloroflexota bacterium]
MTWTEPIVAHPGFSASDGPREEDMYKCVHCGFCLQACPTYLETGLETESPRGRIALMKAVNEGRIGITPQVYRHWDLCIQCRACEVACPSGVPYGNLIEATMSEVEQRRKKGLLARVVGTFVLNSIMPKQGRLEFVASGLRLYQSSGLQSAVRKTKILTTLAPGLAELEMSTPTVSQRRFQARGQVYPANGEARARVAILSGCIMPLMHGPEMDAAVRVLTRNGCEVEVTEGQGCCGAIHSHVGDLDRARELARNNIDAFEVRGVNAVIIASAGCGARMKEYGHLLEGDPDYAGRAASFSATVKDIHEYLVELPFTPPTGRVEKRVTYQDSCHLANAQKITDAPRAILNSIPGVELVEMERSDVCCGAGGTYTITERDFSLRVLDSKMKNVGKTGAGVLATANPGCVLQLQYGTQRYGPPVEVTYVTDLLDKAYQREDC